MAFDGIMMRAVIHELQLLIRGRISKIVMPAINEVELHIRAGGLNYRWLLSTDPTVPRTHLRTMSVDKPLEPPAFCTFLRKQIEGGWIEKIEQIGDERILHAHIRTQNELGDPILRVIVFELMGKHSNLILLSEDPRDHTSGAKVLDSIQHVTPAVSRHRIVLPGSLYTPPPEQHKFSLLNDDWTEHVAWAMESLTPYTDDRDWEKKILGRFSGFSPLLAAEVLAVTHALHHDRTVSAVLAILAAWKKQFLEHDYTPCFGINHADQVCFSTIPILQMKNRQTAHSVSECLERVFHEKSERENRRQRAHDLFQVATSEFQKSRSKRQKLQEQQLQSEDAEQWREWGELLTASQHLVSRGSTSIALVNYFDEEMPEITIPIDPLKTANEQAQHFFKKYNKIKTSIPLIHEQLCKTADDQLYWETILQQLEFASTNDLSEIRDELIQLGHLRSKQKQHQRKKRNTKPSPIQVTSSSGISIYIGKNNLQNDYVTFKLGQDHHWWMHTKDIPGSHVLIADPNPDESTLREAAMLAAWFSQARQSSSIPIDLTKIKHVKKPAKAKPGFVIYEQQRTLIIHLDEATISRLIEPSKK